LLDKGHSTLFDDPNPVTTKPETGTETEMTLQDKTDFCKQPRRDMDALKTNHGSAMQASSVTGWITSQSLVPGTPSTGGWRIFRHGKHGR